MGRMTRMHSVDRGATSSRTYRALRREPETIGPQESLRPLDCWWIHDCRRNVSHGRRRDGGRRTHPTRTGTMVLGDWPVGPGTLETLVMGRTSRRSTSARRKTWAWLKAHENRMKTVGPAGPQAVRAAHTGCADVIGFTALWAWK